ncbi:hypothetical protein F8153_14395 [Alkaliphilus serpentinus]|uniref:Uncharacterized protein n=1 Tax=Alkaliphilus serpentinus TaxID=1482731 RepID=A0A833HM95_9FIRM|nr:hypothetical protein F8153_14395 [Alkaliphilus serpentinus]
MGKYSKEESSKALQVVSSIISKCEKIQPRTHRTHRDGSCVSLPITIRAIFYVTNPPSMTMGVPLI